MLSAEEAWDKYNQAASRNLTDIQYGDLDTDKDDKAVPALWAQRAMFMFTWTLATEELKMQLNTAITLLCELNLNSVDRVIALLDELNGSVGEPSSD